MLLLYFTKKCIFLQNEREKSHLAGFLVFVVFGNWFSIVTLIVQKRYNVIQVFICVVKKYIRRLRVECLQKKGLAQR